MNTRFAWIAGLLIATVGCGGGSGSRGPLTIELLEPSADTLATKSASGAVVEVLFRVFGGDDPATTIFADRDGDPATVGDQILLAAGVEAPAGVTERIPFDIGPVDPGCYTIFAVAVDSAGDRVQAEALGKVRVSTSTASQEDMTALVGASELAPRRDGSVVLVSTAFEGETVYGAGEENPVELTTGVWDDALSPSRNGAILALYGPDGGLRFARQNGGWFGNVNAFLGMLRRPAVATFPDNSFVLVDTYRGLGRYGDGALDLFSTPNGSGTPTPDGAVLRYAPDGTIDWVREVRGTGSVFLQHVAVLPDGGVLVVGLFTGIARIGDVELDGGTRPSLFVARLTAEGGVSWARAERTLDTSGFLIFSFAAVCIGDRAVVATAAFGRFQVDGRVLGRTGEQTLVVVTYDAAGTATTVRSATADFGTAQSPGVIRPTHLEVDDTGTVQVWGQARGHIRIDDGSTVDLTLGIFRARWDLSGELVDFGRPEPRNMHLPTRDGGYFTAGHFNSSVTLAAGSPEETTFDVSGQGLYVARYDAADTLVWARADRVGPANTSLRFVRPAPDGSVILLGQGIRPTFGAGTPNEVSFTVPVVSGYLVRLTPDGDF